MFIFIFGAQDCTTEQFNFVHLVKSLMKSVRSDETGGIINQVDKICRCVLLTSFILKKLFNKNNCYSIQFPIRTIPPSMPFLIFQSGSFAVPIRDHLRYPSGIISVPVSFAVQFGDHLRSGIICGPEVICGPEIICGPVQDRIK